MSEPLEFKEPLEPELDRALLRKGLDWVDEQDDRYQRGEDGQWRQATWLSVAEDLGFGFGYTGEFVELGIAEMSCGTSGCLCGYLATVVGAEVSACGVYNVRFNGLNPVDFGAQLLGISRENANWLFTADNDRETLHDIASQLAGEPM